MRLSQGLRLVQQDLPPRLALVGAGGKTSALFRLARELLETPRRDRPRQTVFLSASTHLATEQLALADFHVVVEKLADLEVVKAPPGVVLFTGPQVEAERTTGLSGALLDRLRAIADEQEAPLLLEADGSRRRPLKAPADHEPAVPDWVDFAVVVAGLSAMGRPLSAEWVHRPERFAGLSGLALGEPVTQDALARVLLHPQGGLKGLPPGARRAALLNQADTPALQAQALRLAERLLPSYPAVLTAALVPQSPGESRTGPVFAVHEPVAGVILAAGASRRLGQAKQLLLWRGLPLVRHVARTALAARLSPLVVVTGSRADAVQAALADLPVEFAHNPGWESGQSLSLHAGLSVLPPETGAVVFLLADQPHIPASLVRSLVERHSATLSPLVAPQIDGQRANPVLFDRQTFPDLMALQGDVGGRALFSRYPVAWVAWHDAALTLDVDTLEDYQRLLEM